VLTNAKTARRFSVVNATTVTTRRTPRGNGDMPLVDRILNGNYEKPEGLYVAKLFPIEPLVFSDIRQDVWDFMTRYKPSSVSHTDHHTNWTKPYGRCEQWNLWDPNGDTAGFYAGECGSFAYSGWYFHLARFMDLFDGITSFRINLMHPHSGLGVHKEEIVLQGPKLKLRFHLPLWTNDQAEVLLPRS
jgi:hypothetical protein